MTASDVSGAPFSYARLAADLGALIRAGGLRPGDRLPSVRRMSVQRGVSIPTVVRAYHLLEAERLIEARPQSGHYVRLARPPRSAVSGGPGRLVIGREIATADLIMRCLEMASDPTLIPLGTALPDPDLLPTATLARLLGRAARRVATGRATVTGYGALATAAGTEELRHEIARRAVETGSLVQPEDVVVTCGCAEALALSLRVLTRPGDTVAVESPTYFGTLQELDVLGLRALEIPTNAQTGMDTEVLAAALAGGGVAAVVITPNVHNPLGGVMPNERKRALVALLAAHGVPAIEDETYADLYFAPERPRSLRSFDRDGLVLTCGSFSKTLAPTYRVGWAIPGRFRDAVLHVKLATTVATPVPLQHALAEYLGSGGYERHLRRLRRIFRGNLDRLRAEMMKRFPTGTRISRPDGGFLLWVQLPHDVDAVELQRRALRRGLSVAPGPAFSASGAYPACIRVNAGYAWSARTAAALDLLAELVGAVRKV